MIARKSPGEFLPNASSCVVECSAPYRVSSVRGVFRRFARSEVTFRLVKYHQADQICRSQVIEDFESNGDQPVLRNAISIHRARHSTETALLMVQEDIITAFDNGGAV